MGKKKSGHKAAPETKTNLATAIIHLITPITLMKD